MHVIVKNYRSIWLAGKLGFEPGASARQVTASRGHWALAVRMAKLHGVNRTVLAFGLDRQYLQRQIASLDAPAQGLTSCPAFVPLSTPNLTRKECRIDLDNGAAATMRVQSSGYTRPISRHCARGF